LAQDRPVEKTGGRATFPLSGFKDSLNTGRNFEIGATFWVSPNIGILAEYDYTRMNGPEKTINVTPSPADVGGIPQFIQSNQQIRAGVFDVVGRSHNRDSVINGYVMGGLGIYHRGIQLTSPATGYTTICDPFWLVCYPVATPITQILGERTSNDFGINFGGGVTFGHEAKFYVEARYTYVWGPTITPPASNLPTTPTTFSSNAQYLPLIFGVRF
jgi:hypothetical protein